MSTHSKIYQLASLFLDYSTIIVKEAAVDVITSLPGDVKHERANMGFYKLRGYVAPETQDFKLIPKQVSDSLFRGPCPDVLEIPSLYHDYNIRRIISLDKDAYIYLHTDINRLNNKVDPSDKLEHILYDVDKFLPSMNPENAKSFAENFKQNLLPKLLDGKKTYVHCRWGKDRTGLIFALYDIATGKSRDDALSYAREHAFCAGCDREYTNDLHSLLDRFYNRIVQENK